MGDVVNLRRFRKGKAREAEAATADANRLAFGLTRGQRETSALLKAHSDRALDGAKRDGAEPERS